MSVPHSLSPLAEESLPAPSAGTWTVLFLEDEAHPQFAPARTFLAAHGTMHVVKEASAGLMAIAAGFVPMLIVVAQARPGQISTSDIEALMRAAPLARALELAGCWCEGEERSGDVWPGVQRVYWHQWLPRLERQRQRWLQGRSPQWSAAVTQSAEERYLEAAGHEVPQCQGTIVVLSSRYESGRWISDACRRAGFTVVQGDGARSALDADLRLRGLAAVVWDSDEAAPGDLQGMRSVAAAIRPAPLLLIAGFPRPETAAAAISAGACGVLCKPLELDDLFWWLAALPQA